VRERAGVLQASWLAEAEAKTLHRLLGWRSGPSGGWRHHRGRRLPHDVVIIDEASMVSLTLMGRLADALRPGARLVLVGDPDQLTSVEAGAVLGDIVRAGGEAIEVLEQVHRFGPEIGRVAAAVRDGDADAAVAALSAVGGAVEWVAADPADAEGGPGVVRDAVRAAGEAVIAAARAGDREAALGALEGFRLLCAHRFGAHGVARWSAVAEGWLAGALDAHGEAFYVGRPLMVTRNDYDVRLFNGDTGVVVAGDGGRAVAVFDRGGELVEVAPSRLETVDTVYAMTIHKSQGSQFATVAVLLPPPESPVLTRELLYTAVTRARERLVVVGTEASVRAAVGRPAARASALAERLGGAVRVR
jgi:exodeoxyribonuclease V alpha subunit